MEFAEFIKISQVEGVVLSRQESAPIEGTLCITGHHLILASRQENKEELWVCKNSTKVVATVKLMNSSPR